MAGKTRVDDDEANPFEEAIAKALKIWPQAEQFRLANLIIRANAFDRAWEWSDGDPEPGVRILGDDGSTIKKLKCPSLVKRRRNHASSIPPLRSSRSISIEPPFSGASATRPSCPLTFNSPAWPDWNNASSPVSPPSKQPANAVGRPSHKRFRRPLGRARRSLPRPTSSLRSFSRDGLCSKSGHP
jgi:hypothetical protein